MPEGIGYGEKTKKRRRSATSTMPNQLKRRKTQSKGNKLEHFRTRSTNGKVTSRTYMDATGRQIVVKKEKNK